MKVEHPEQEGEITEEEKHPPCPTCNEEWDGKAVFCYWCGYQELDEENPLHPLPGIDGGVSDSASVLSDVDKSGLIAVIGELGDKVPVIFATFRTPEDYSPAGIAFTLYNNWSIGHDGADNGFLVLWDPDRNRIEIACGRELNLPAGNSGLSDAANCFAGKIADGDIAGGFRELTGKILG